MTNSHAGNKNMSFNLAAFPDKINALDFKFDQQPEGKLLEEG